MSYTAEEIEKYETGVAGEGVVMLRALTLGRLKELDKSDIGLVLSNADYCKIGDCFNFNVSLKCDGKKTLKQIENILKPIMNKNYGMHMGEYYASPPYKKAYLKAKGQMKLIDNEWVFVGSVVVRDNNLLIDTVDEPFSDMGVQQLLGFEIGNYYLEDVDEDSDYPGEVTAVDFFTNRITGRDAEHCYDLLILSFIIGRMLDNDHKGHNEDEAKMVTTEYLQSVMDKAIKVLGYNPEARRKFIIELGGTIRETMYDLF